MAEYANWKSGQVESLVILSVQLRLRLLHDPVVQWRRRLGDIQKIDGSNPSGVNAMEIRIWDFGIRV